MVACDVPHPDGAVEGDSDILVGSVIHHRAVHCFELLDKLRRPVGRIPGWIRVCAVEVMADRAARMRDYDRSSQCGGCIEQYSDRDSSLG